MSSAKYIMIDDPKERNAAAHKCEDGFPKLNIRGHGIWWRTIIECEECAKIWWAHVYADDSYRDSGWVELKWYHFKMQRRYRKARNG